MKLNCLIDTCSCVYLSKAYFRQKPILRYLFEATKLRYSKEVSLEIKDHKKDGIPNFIDNEAFTLLPAKRTTEEYEVMIVGSVMPSRVPGGNKGEVDNLIIALDQIHHLKINTSIYITDDKDAIRRILPDWFSAFPTLKLWTSYEVILFLYAEKIIPSLDIAETLLQDIISILAPPEIPRKPSKTQELIEIRNNYAKKLRTISKILS